MKRFLTGATILAVLTIAAFIINDQFLANESNNEQAFLKVNKDTPAAREAAENGLLEKKERNNRNEQGIKYAALYLQQLRANPTTGKIDPADIMKARQMAAAMRNNPNSRKASLGLDWEGLGPDNIGGRTRGFLIDKNNSQKLYMGGVTGGLFVSENGGNSWTVHPDYPKFGHQGISTIAQAPNGDIYFGTGESFVVTSENSVGHLGGGMYKSTDGGQTFDLLPSTEPDYNEERDPWGWVNEIQVDPNNSNIVYAAVGYRSGITRGGLYKSTDAGISWNLVTSGLSGADSIRYSNEVLVTANSVVHASINDKYYRSTDGENFTLMSGVAGFPAANVTSRIEFAVSPQDPNYVYSAQSNNQSGTYGVFRSTDGGANWSGYSPVDSETFNPFGSQGDYNIAFAVNSADKDEVVLGGQLELYKGGNNVGWDQIANGGGGGNPTFFYSVHADMHNVTFDPTDPNIMYVTTDGGLFKSIDAQEQFPTFIERNKGYTTTQYYDIGVGLNGRVAGGMQDNGTVMVDGQGNTLLSSFRLGGGDGGYTEISKLNPDAIFIESQFGSVRRSSNGGTSFGSVWSSEIDGDGDGTPDGNQTSFIPTFRLWEEIPIDTIVIDSVTNLPDTIYGDPRGILAFGAQGRLYVTQEALDFSTTPIWNRVLLPNASMVTAIDVTAGGVFYVGTSNGRVYRVEGLPTATYITPSQGNAQPAPQGVNITEIWSSVIAGIGSRYVSGLGIDPNDDDHVIVTMSQYGENNYVYRSTNATTNSPVFNNIQSDLPPMPVYDAVIDYYDSDNYIIGTDLGVWTSSDRGATWVEENMGIPSVPTFTVEQHALYDDGCQVIYAGTYGHGLFRTTSLVADATGGSCDLVPYKEIVVGINEIDLSEIASSALYPNPIVNEAILELELKAGSDINVRVISLDGKITRNMELGTYAQGFHKFNLDFTDVPRGMYMVTIETNNGVKTNKVFVAK